MTKKETASTGTSIKTEGNNNKIHFHIGDNNPNVKREKKPNWVVKAMVIALISLAVTLVAFFVENAGNHSEPIHNDPPAILPDRK